MAIGPKGLKTAQSALLSNRNTDCSCR